MWIRITVCGRTYGLIEIKINLRLTIDYVRQFILWRQYVCKSSKIVIEARTEASSRRAFIGYIFIHERSSTETNDFTLLLFPSFFFLSSFPIYRFDFRCENASFSALKRLIESSNFKIDPRTNTPRRRNRDRERTRSEKKMGKHREISFISSLHYTRQSFSTVSQKWTFPFQRHPNDDKKKKSSCVRDDQTFHSNSIDSNNLVLPKMFAPYRYSRDVGIPSRTVCFNLFSPRSFLDKKEIVIELWFASTKSVKKCARVWSSR